MHKKMIAMFYFVGLSLWIISAVLFIRFLVSGNTQPNIGQFIVEIVVGWIGGMLIIISCVGALINSAKTGRWRWFICLLLLSAFALPVYLFTSSQPV